MRHYTYSEPCEDLVLTYVISEDDIISKYWDEWRALMEKEHGRYSDLITRENCIQDWCMIHWATQLDKEEIWE